MVPLRGLAPGSACPFHPACAGSSLWRWPRLTAEGRYPLPCPLESGLSSAACADATVRPARSFILPACGRVLVRDQRSRHLVYEPACSDHVFGHRVPRQLAVIRKQPLSRVLSCEQAHVVSELRDVEKAAPQI